MSTAPASLAELLDRIAADPVLATLLAEARARDAALATPDPSHDTAHLLRVALWTLRIGAESGSGAGGADQVNAREAVAAALLHDAVHVPKDSPDRARASELAADFARERLAALGFDGPAVARIAAAVRDHSFSRGAVPEDALGCALQDADRLEVLGAIGWLRCISTGVRMRADWFHADDPWAAARELDGTGVIPWTTCSPSCSGCPPRCAPPLAEPKPSAALHSFARSPISWAGNWARRPRAEAPKIRLRCQSR